jgi:8-oxo-dGTP pyrophosphatase MutT (NUDIX family)
MAKGRTFPDDPKPWKVLSREYLSRKFWYTVRVDKVETPTGAIIPEYWVNEYVPWISVVAITPDDHVVMIRQYRHGLAQVHFEIPAGTTDASDESLEAAARRELLEETGYGGGRWHSLGSLHPAASRFNNQVHSFLALGVTRVAAPAQEESENLHLHEIPWGEFVAGLRAGTMRLREANQMSSLLLVHLLAGSSDDPEIGRLKL